MNGKKIERRGAKQKKKLHEDDKDRIRKSINTFTLEMAGPALSPGRVGQKQWANGRER